MELIKLENIEKSFFDSELPILKNINLTINTQDLVVILGISGSGKTTLLNIISSLEKATDGMIYTQEGLKFSYVTQQAHFIEELTIENNLRVAALKTRADIFFYCNYFECSHLLKKKPSHLSGGEKQRVNIIRSLLKEPHLLILDEPTASLDYANKIKVIHLLNNLKQEKNMAILLVTHDTDIIEHLSDKRVYELKNTLLTEKISLPSQAG